MLFGKYVNKYYLKYGLVMLLGIAALLAVDYFQLLVPDLVGNIVDGLENKTLIKDELRSYISEILLIAVVMFTGRFLWRVCLFGTGVKVETDLRNEVFKNMQFLSQRFYNQNKTGALMAIYTNDLSMVRQTFGMGTMMLVDAVCLGAMALYKMFALNVWLSLFSLISLVLVMIISKSFGKKITKATENNFKAFGEMSDYVQEDFSGIGVIKAFVKEKLQVLLFARYNQKNMDTCLDMTKLSTKFSVALTAILSIISTLIMAYGGYLIYLKSTGNPDITFTLGDLIKFSAYFGTLIWPIQAVGMLIDFRSKGIASLNRVSALIDETKEINDDLVPEENKSIVELNGDIEYNGLSFAYPGSVQKSLTDVNLKINKGEFVGIIGATGSGKTTLVDLLLRIYNIEEETLFIDGIDIMKLPLSTVRNNIAYVPQDNFLYGEEIINNIAFSEKEEVDEEKAHKVAKISDVYDDIVEFSNGFNTELGERGVTVSGGQKQRISIARALYKDSNILILDDSLSAVDTETEKAIITNLREIRKGKTTIIIAHRISTLQNLDKIVVVEDGTISGIGTHKELLVSNKAYAREAKLQELEKKVGDSNE